MENKIYTNHLVLRDLSIKDNHDWLEMFSSEKVAMFLEKIDDIEKINRIIEKKINSYKENSGGSFSILEKTNDKVIGNIEIKVISPLLAELSYVINDKYWNKGYCTEACKAIIDYAFKEWNLSKIVADCRENNTASAHILVDKLLFTQLSPTIHNGIKFLNFELNRKI